MKSIKYSLVGVIAAVGLGSGAANGSVLLAVDLQSSGGSTQTGFDSWFPSDSDTASVSTTTIGTFTLTSAAGATKAALTGTGAAKNSRNRNFFAPNSGSFTQQDLMRDRLTSGGVADGTLAEVDGTEIGLYVRVAGLAASTTYSLQVWGIDWTSTASKTGYNAIYDDTTTLTSLGSYTIGSGVTTIADNNTYSVISNITSDASGNIIFKSISNIDGTGIMNGFTVSSIPEPSSALLSLLGLTALAGIRRRA